MRSNNLSLRWCIFQIRECTLRELIWAERKKMFVICPPLGYKVRKSNFTLFSGYTHFLKIRFSIFLTSKHCISVNSCFPGLLFFVQIVCDNVLYPSCNISLFIFFFNFVYLFSYLYTYFMENLNTSHSRNFSIWDMHLKVSLSEKVLFGSRIKCLLFIWLTFYVFSSSKYCDFSPLSATLASENENQLLN